MTYTTTTDTYIRLRACTDCIMLIVNGDTSGTPRCETEEGEVDYLAAVAANTEGLHLVAASWEPPARAAWYDYNPEDVSEIIALAFAGEVQPEDFTFDLDGVVLEAWTEDDRYYGRDTESQFSMSSCDVCDEGLGGDRHPVVAFVTTTTTK